MNSVKDFKYNFISNVRQNLNLIKEKKINRKVFIMKNNNVFDICYAKQTICLNFFEYEIFCQNNYFFQIN